MCMDQPSRIKFEDIVQFDGSTGFSNRSNCYVSDLRSFLKNIPAQETHEFVVTKKIDGVAVMIVAFIGKQITPKAGESVHIIEDWPWDRNKSDFTEDKNAEFYRKALRAYLLPHTVWSRRENGGQDYYLNIALYSPTCKSLQIPHYLRKGIEDYVIAYYQSIPDNDRPPDDKIKSIILRGELFIGKAGPTAATTFLGHHRTLKTGKDGVKYPWMWSQILSLQRDMAASQKVAEDKNKRNKKNPQHHAETATSVYESALEKWYDLTGQTDKDKQAAQYAPFFGLRNFMVDAQWNPSLVIEGENDPLLEMHSQQLGLSVLDDYTGRMTESFKEKEIKQRNLDDIGEDIVWVVTESIKEKYVSFSRRYSFLRGETKKLEYFMNDSILQHTLVHTVPVLKRGNDVNLSFHSAITHDDIDKYCDFIADELKRYNYIENGEGFMLIQDKHKGLKHNVTRCWKIKNFHLTPVFDEKYMTTWGFFDEIVDEAGNGEKRITNKHAEPSKTNNEFLEFIYAVNLKHFLTVSGPGKFTREQSKAWLNSRNANPRAHSLTPYEPYIFTMAPWGVFKNLNSIIPSSDINTNDKLSISDIITSSQGANGHAENFLLWIQYVHTCRIRLMAPPILDGRFVSINARNDSSRFKKAFMDKEHDSTRSHMSLSKDEKHQAMLLQLFGIAKIVHMSLDETEEISDNKQRRLHLLGQVTKQLCLTHLRASVVSQEKYSRFRIGNQFYYQLLDLIAESLEIDKVATNPVLHDTKAYRDNIQRYSELGIPTLFDDVRQLYGLGKKNKDDKHLRRQIQRIIHLYEETSYERESDGKFTKKEGLFDPAMLVKLAFAFSYKSNSLGPMKDAFQEECLTKMTTIIQADAMSKGDTSAEAVRNRKNTSLMLWHTHKIKSMPTMPFDILSSGTFMGLRGSLEHNAPLSSFCGDDWQGFMTSVLNMKWMNVMNVDLHAKLQTLFQLKKEDLDLDPTIRNKEEAERARLEKFHITTLPNHWVFCSTNDEDAYTTKLNQGIHTQRSLWDETHNNFTLYFENDYAKETKATCEWVVEHLCFANENRDLVKKIITAQIEIDQAINKNQDKIEDRQQIKILKRRAQGQKQGTNEPLPTAIFFDPSDADIIHKDVLNLLREKLKFDLNITQERIESSDLDITPDNVDNCALQEILLVAASGIEEDQFGMETEVDDEDELQHLMLSQESERTPASLSILRKTRDLVSVDLSSLENFLPVKDGALDPETRDTMRRQLRQFLRDQIQCEAVESSDEDIVSVVPRHVPPARAARARRVAPVKGIKVGSDVGEVDFIVILYAMYRRSKHSRHDLKLSEWLQTVPTIRKEVVDIAQAFRARK